MKILTYIDCSDKEQLKVFQTDNPAIVIVKFENIEKDYVHTATGAWYDKKSYVGRINVTRIFFYKESEVNPHLPIKVQDARG